MDYYAGLDVSLEATSVCVVNDEGKVVREGKVSSDPEAIELFLSEWGFHLKRVGLEAFSSAPGCSPLSMRKACRCSASSAYTKSALNAMLNKTDRNDARCRARASSQVKAALRIGLSVAD